MLRLVVADDDVAFDLAGSAFGRGAHVHARLDCLMQAPRGLGRAFKGGRRQGESATEGASRPPRSAIVVTPSELGARLVAASNQRIRGLLLAARRLGAVAVGADAAFEALARGAYAAGDGQSAPLAIVAVDAASIADTIEVRRAVAAGRAIAWSTKLELGALLGEQAVAICTVRHESIAAELLVTRAAADAGAAATREGAGCSRCPEAR